MSENHPNYIEIEQLATRCAYAYGGLQKTQVRKEEKDEALATLRKAEEYLKIWSSERLRERDCTVCGAVLDVTCENGCNPEEPVESET